VPFVRAAGPEGLNLHSTAWCWSAGAAPAMLESRLGGDDRNTPLRAPISGNGERPDAHAEGAVMTRAAVRVD